MTDKEKEKLLSDVPSTLKPSFEKLLAYIDSKLGKKSVDKKKSK